MLDTVFIALLISTALLMIRGFIGPTLFDRLLVVNTFGTFIVVIIAMLGLIMETDYFIDVAIIYALINFITNIAILKFFKHRQANKDFLGGGSDASS